MSYVDYSGGSSAYRPSVPPSHVVHKPDEISSADLQPPPPYSPGGSSSARKSSDSNTYGSTINEQQQGLLGQSSYGNARSKPVPQNGVLWSLFVINYVLFFSFVFFPISSTCVY